MIKSPKVSIGLPVYNGEKYLAAAIESVLSQDFGDFEFFISDNTSTDGTWDICRHYEAKDKRIRLNRNEENVGAIRNYEITFAGTSAPLFMWMAHDDLLKPKYVGSCVTFLENKPDYILCCSRNIFIDECGTELYCTTEEAAPDSHDMLERLIAFTNYFNHPNIFYGLMRREAAAGITLKKVHLFDLIFMRELSLAGKFFQISEPLKYYRLRKWTGPKHKIDWYPKLLFGTNSGFGLFPSMGMNLEWIACVHRMKHDLKTKVKILGASMRKHDLKNAFLSDFANLAIRCTYRFPSVYNFLRRIRGQNK